MRNALATLGAALACLAAAAHATDGFRVYTAEAARRRDVERAPPLVPSSLLADQHGRAFSLPDSARGRFVVSFVYTRCPDLCTWAGRELGAIAAQLPEASPRGPALLNVSFDSQHDAPPALRAFAARHGADGERWRVARLYDPAALRAWLGVFGVVVIPDGFGGFEHNAALHLVDERGRLVRILDLGATREAAEFLAAVPAGASP